MKRISQKEAWTGVADCRNCGVRQSVLFAKLTEADFEAVHRPIDQFSYGAGSEIFNTSDQADSIYTIRSGLVKLSNYLPDGTTRIVRLLRTSDAMGLEALFVPHYENVATALRETELCRIPKDTICELATGNPRLFSELMARWHRALSDADRHILEFNTGTSRARVARLLLWLCDNEDDGRCQLFGREDLGALLGLTTETVSRVMAELKRNGLISELRANEFMCDVPNLRRLAGEAD